MYTTLVSINYKKENHKNNYKFLYETEIEYITLRLVKMTS